MIHTAFLICSYLIFVVTVWVKIIIGIGKRIDSVQIIYPILVSFFIIIYSNPSVNESKAAIRVVKSGRFKDGEFT